jgi:O-antigen/teichoic acid export membrane protein
MSLAFREPAPLWLRAANIYVFQGLSLGLGLVASVLSARTLGPAGKGVLDLFGLLNSVIVEFGLFGIGSGLLYQVANQRHPVAQVHSNAIAVSAAVGGVGLAAAVLAPSIAVALVGPIPNTVATVALALAGVTAYSALWPSLMIGSNRTSVTYRVQFGLAAINLTLVVALFVAGWISVASLVAVGAAMAVGAAILQALILKSISGAGLPAPSIPEIRSAGSYGLAVFPGVLANWLHFRVDQVVISHVLGISSLGIYALSVRWAEMLWMIGYGVMNAGLFRIASSSRIESYALSVRLFFVVLGLTGMAGFLLALIAGSLFALLYGPAFAGAVLPLILLIPGVVAWDASRVLSQFISFNLGRPRIPTAVAVLGAVLNVPLTLYVVPQWGFAGAALVSTLSYTVVLILIALAFRKLRWAT